MKYFVNLTLITILTTTCISSYGQLYFYHPKSGVKINFGVNNEMFPQSWTVGDIDGQAESLSPKEYKRSKRIIIKALAKYPAYVLRENLREVYILSSLRFYGQIYGGTNSSYNVYVVNSGKADGYSDEYFEQLIHAEFSSILLRNYTNSAFEDKWGHINDEDFTYGTGGVDEIRKGKAGTDYLPEYFEKGFLYQYAMSGMENDFNSISKNLFCPDNSFWQEGFTFNNLKLKVILTIDFYSKISDSFNIEYFKSIEEE